MATVDKEKSYQQKRDYLNIGFFPFIYLLVITWSSLI